MWVMFCFNQHKFCKVSLLLRKKKIKMSENFATTMNEILEKKIQEWLSWDKNEETAGVIRELQKHKKYDQLSKMLLNRLTFGTAGLRGKMAAGYNGMNDLVIIQTGQGLLSYLEEAEPKLLEKNGIVIGYDGRHHSKRFAELTASIFLHNKYPVHLFSDLVPTPFVPFAVNELKCAAGVMVTASHNPKDDNGYKVYGKRGTQYIPPADKNIQKHILENLKPRSSSWDTDIIRKSNDPLPDILAEYLRGVDKVLINEHKNINKASDLIFTYTPMHGVGYKYIKKVFDVAAINYVVVEEQKDPHPEFPTVKFPNPEEGKSSLDLSFKTADKCNSPIVIANDPDADRLAVAEKNNCTEQWKIFTGNELGALLGWWALYCYQTEFPNEPLSDCYMISSTVSSKILRTMAVVEGFSFVETLTGFKWMGNKGYDLLKDDKQVIFAFEESIGYMFGSRILDKDGIGAGVQMATMSTFLYKHGLTLNDQLTQIYKEYGYHISKDSYFICNDAQKINKIFQRIRNFPGKNTYPSGILNDKYKISSIRDLTTGYDSSQKNKKATLPVSKSSHMITFNFENGLVLTLRTSGTEPKIKYYTELISSPNEQDIEKIRKTLHEMVHGIVEEFLEPEKHSLIPKAD